jgi:deoxyribonuclease V
MPRLGQYPSSYFVENFDRVRLNADAGGETVCAQLGEGDRAFDVHLPIEFGAPRTDLIPILRSVLSEIAEMDDAVRAASMDDEQLVAVTIREFFVELRYWSQTQNGDRAEYFTLTDDRWRRRGVTLPWMPDWPSRAPGAVMALDVAYAETHAAAAGVYFTDWTATAPAGAFAKRVEAEPHGYAAGQFYKRELPVLMRLIDESPVAVSTFIIDGYVWLSGDDKPGLGARLYEALAREAPVVGVAKTRLRGDSWSKEVRRGVGAAPLYVTAAGMAPEKAAQYVRDMSGAHRIPALLKRADEIARKAL